MTLHAGMIVVCVTFSLTAARAETLEQNQQLTAPQVPTISSQTSVQIDPAARATSTDTRVDQPYSGATDQCDTQPTAASYNGIDCGTVALRVERLQRVIDRPVDITEDGVFLRLGPQSDEVFDPDKIVRRLELPTIKNPNDWGVGGAVISLDDPASDFEPVDSPDTVLSINPEPLE